MSLFLLKMAMLRALCAHWRQALTGRHPLGRPGLLMEGAVQWLASKGGTAAVVTMAWGACFSTAAVAQIGFHAPEGVGEYFPGIDFSLINVHMKEPPGGEAAIAIDELIKSFSRTDRSSHRIHLDVGQAVTRTAGQLARRYTQANGRQAEKLLAPQEAHKLRVFLPPEQIRKHLTPLVSRLKPFRKRLGCLFLADEPYMAGLSPEQYDDAAKVVRQLFRQHGWPRVCIGVIFAGAMFDPAFAHHMNAQMGRYVERIDDFYRGMQSKSTASGAKGRDARQWIDSIRTSRLTTYDQAGNIHLHGGIPREVDVVTFDFYLSTLLLDGAHALTLDWMASRFPNGACESFRHVNVEELRKRLVFFGHQAERSARRLESDRRLLDQLFECRMSTTLSMLERHLELAGLRSTQVMLVGESSPNGVLEFDARGHVLSGQDFEATSLRMRDEVRRYVNFYLRNRHHVPAGLMFFTSASAYDESIKLHVGGAAGFPSVMAEIFEARRTVRNLRDAAPVVPVAR